MIHTSYVIDVKVILRTIYVTNVHFFTWWQYIT